MIDHTVDQVRATERYFRSQGFEYRERSVAGRNIDYYVLPQALNHDLPYFVLRVTNGATKEHVFGVSDTVPKNLQDYFALQEHIEFLDLGIGTKGRVVQAERTTVSHVPDSVKECYLRTRVELFRRELSLSLKEPEKYALDKEDRQEFEENLRYLEAELVPIEEQHAL